MNLFSIEAALLGPQVAWVETALPVSSLGVGVSGVVAGCLMPGLVLGAADLTGSRSGMFGQPW